MIKRFRSVYGAHPAHLLAHLLAFILFVWAFRQILGGGYVVNYVGWFLGAAVLHDLVALPLYSLLDRAGTLATRRTLGPHARSVLNHIRVPAIVSGVLLLVYFPLILGPSGKNYRSDTGHPLHGYLRNWVLVTLGLLLTSAVVYLLKRLIRRAPSAEPTAPTAPGS